MPELARPVGRSAWRRAVFGVRTGIWVSLVASALSAYGCHDDDSAGVCDDTLTPYSADTEIGELYDTCFPRCAECDSAAVEAVLYMDTTNLPSVNADIPKLVLTSLPIAGGSAGGDRLEFFFDGKLPGDVDPGIRDELGWKVQISAATLGYCEVCWTNCGLAPILKLDGELSSVTFFRDPSDTVGIYIERHPR